MSRMAQSQITQNLTSVLQRIAAACEKRPDPSRLVRLVAVSKYKHVDDVHKAYIAGQRHFGENYTNELAAKSKHAMIIEKCPEIQWHYIGSLDSQKKIKQLISCRNLHMIQTINSIQTADIMDTAWSTKVAKQGILKCMIQVNTSGEQQKSGISPTHVVSLYKHITDKCNNLKLTGLMCIGSLKASMDNETTNTDFECLVKCRHEVCTALNLNETDIELSMGMSHDFERAIEMGSTSIRVGSLIFGERYK